jgi:AcrR family transcriptional regulator
MAKQRSDEVTASARRRPLQERGRVTVDAILEATARLLVEQGFSKLTTNRVALLAGVSIGSVYQYYPSKEALLAALIERHSDEVYAALERPLLELGKGACIRDVVGSAVRGMMASHRVSPELHRVLVQEMTRVGRVEQLEANEARGLALIERVLTSKGPMLRPKNSHLAACIITSAVHAITRDALVKWEKELDREEIIAETTELVVRYLSKNAQPA